MTKTNTKEKIFADLYSEQENFLFPEEVRLNSVNLFHKTEIPGKKTENWRKFNSKPIFSHNYKLGKKLKLDVSVLDTLSFYKSGSNCIIITNGYYNEELSENKNNEIFIGSLKSARENKNKFFEKYLSKPKNTVPDYFSLLNDAYVKDGAFIYVPDNVKLESPIYIMHFIQSVYGNIFSQNRNLIIAGKNTSFKVIHTFHSLSSDFSFNNTFTDIYLEEDAHIEYCLFEGEGNTASHVNSVNINSEKRSSFKSNVVTFCGSVVRNNFYANFSGTNAEINLQGIYLPDKEQYVDNFVNISHSKPNCRSNQLFKGLIDNKAVAVFTGKVFVARDAQKTDSAQSNQNLLLTDYARAHSRPRLEIYADDVACSHGSTTGQLDKEALFYMKTRGIPEKKAKTMLMKAFLKDVTNNIWVTPYRDYVNFLITKRLKGQGPESLCSVQVCPSCT